MSSKFSELIQQLKKNLKLVRITFLGDGGVGKTSVMQAVIKHITDQETFIEKTKRTPFLNIESWKQDGFTVQCYDIAGQIVPGAHPTDILREQTFGTLDLVIFVFALDRFSSFENLENWLETADSNYTDKPIEEKPKYMLVGNKADLKKAIYEETIDAVIGPDKSFSYYIETSTVTETGITDLINKISEIAAENLEE